MALAIRFCSILLWTFNSLYEIHYKIQLYDVEVPTFNSLYEIPNAGNRAYLLIGIFQFSLWDSHTHLKPRKRLENWLSILFMRFIPVFSNEGLDCFILSILFMRFGFAKIPAKSWACKLSILFMRFAEKGADVQVQNENFQFSLWDSWQNPGFTRDFTQNPFNSLYEIRILPALPSSTKARRLSILFMRFRGRTES